MIKIQLTDINDNRPTFYPREYNVSLRESLSTSTTSSTPVVVVVATDPDSGRFGTVTYRINAGNEAGIFRIDRVSGELFVTRPNMLSNRNQPYHRLNISASDGGGLRTNQDAEVFISIIDSAQRPPIFDKPRYTYYVKEDVKKSTVVGAVSATSSNSGEFLFNIYIYFFLCSFLLNFNGHLSIIRDLLKKCLTKQTIYEIGKIQNKRKKTEFLKCIQISKEKSNHLVDIFSAI